MYPTHSFIHLPAQFPPRMDKKKAPIVNLDISLLPSFVHSMTAEAAVNGGLGIRRLRGCGNDASWRHFFITVTCMSYCYMGATYDHSQRQYAGGCDGMTWEGDEVLMSGVCWWRCSPRAYHTCMRSLIRSL